MEAWLELLLQWLAGHPYWILLALALLSCLESLAIVGILVPGIALLIAVSTVAGSTAIPVWQVLLAGFIGAVVGDGVSYLLGYHYHHVIRRIPPFTTHPQWTQKGEDFFRQYGSLSIVLGRFFGPLRAIVPLVAGLLEMPALKFYAVNILSAAAWAPFYLMPGYLVGQSIEGQGALTTAHLIFLLSVFSLGWLLAQFAQRLHAALQLRARKRRLALQVSALFGGLFILLGITVTTGLLDPMNQAIAHWSFDLRHDWLETAYIGLTIFGEYPSMVLWAALITATLLLQRNAYAAGLWLGFVLLAQALMEMGKRGFGIVRPQLVAEPPGSFAYPSGHTAMSLVFVGLLVSLALPAINARRHQLILSCAGVLIVLMASSRLYLGVHWFSDIVGGWLMGGMVLALFYTTVLYKPFPRVKPWPLLAATLLAWLVSGLLFVYPQFTHWTARYQPLSFQ